VSNKCAIYINSIANIVNIIVIYIVYLLDKFCCIYYIIFLWYNIYHCCVCSEKLLMMDSTVKYGLVIKTYKYIKLA